MAGKIVATTTYNTDVHSIVRRYNRMIVEMVKSQSSGVSLTNPFDIARLTAYVEAMANYQAFIVSQPLLDCPETGPTEMPLPPNADVPVIENESLADAVALMEIARDEIANSQSSRLPTNLMSFDYERQASYLAKIRKLMEYIAKSEPLDLPESSPMADVSGRGIVGV